MPPAWQRPMPSGNFFFKDANQFGGGVGKAGAPAGDEVDVAGHVELADFNLFHPAVFDFPLDAHAGDEGDAHTHLHDAFDAFNGGHFDGHVEGGAIAREELDDAAAEGRFNDVRNEIFFAKFGDVDFFLFGEEVFGRDDQRELILENFSGLELRVPGNVGHGAQVEAII